MKKVRTLAQLEAHEAVVGIDQEWNDPYDRNETGKPVPDYWVVLKKGWKDGEAGTHMFHEWGVRRLLDKFNCCLERCDCDECSN